MEQFKKIAFNEKILWLLVPFYTALLFYTLYSGSAKLKLTAVALPFLLLLGYLAFFHTQKTVYLLGFTLPLSVNLENIGLGVGVSLPGEIITGFIALVVALSWMDKIHISAKVLRHPVTIAIFAYIAWMGITTLTSTMPVVSMKYLFVKICYLLVFYFLFIMIFQKKENIQKFIWAYFLGLLLVIPYTLYIHSQYNFIQEVSYFISKPFFKHHTLYGACLAMMFFFTVTSTFLRKEHRLVHRKYHIISALILFGALVLSYSRAAWLSVFIGMVALLVLLLKLRLWTILLIITGGLLAAWFYRYPLIRAMEDTRSVSGSNISSHLKSITNIESDVSNAERIVRWKAALRMFREKPLSGYGPGTYQFQYGPFQYRHEMTRISTFHGTRGGAHSEYLKPLAESGLPGLLTFLAFIFSVSFTAMNLIYRHPQRAIRITVLGLFLGLITYYAHGFVNFFLDTDKSSALFWGFSAMIVAMDIRNSKKKDLV